MLATHITSTAYVNVSDRWWQYLMLHRYEVWNLCSHSGLFKFCICQYYLPQFPHSKALEQLGIGGMGLCICHHWSRERFSPGYSQLNSCLLLPSHLPLVRVYVFSHPVFLVLLYFYTPCTPNHASAKLLSAFLLSYPGVLWLDLPMSKEKM